MGNHPTAYEFSAKDVQMLVKLSGKTENEIRQWYDEFHKETNQSDRMNKREFQIYYKKLRNNPKLDQLTDHIFRAFDSNHSGTIDFREFIIAYIATTNGTDRQKFEFAFEVFDINENKKIEKKEAEKILKIICKIMDLTELDAKMYTETVMVSFDANQDKVLTKEEFINGCLHDMTLGNMLDVFKL